MYTYRYGTLSNSNVIAAAAAAASSRCIYYAMSQIWDDLGIRVYFLCFLTPNTQKPVYNHPGGPFKGLWPERTSLGIQAPPSAAPITLGMTLLRGEQSGRLTRPPLAQDTQPTLNVFRQFGLPNHLRLSVSKKKLRILYVHGFSTVLDIIWGCRSLRARSPKPEAIVSYAHESFGEQR